MRAFGFTGALLLAAVTVLACGGSQGEKVNYTKGPMPEGGDFDGVYQSDFGRLEINVDNGGKANALYDDGEKYGRMEGEVEDNLLFFSWTQWNEELRGKVRKTSGKGVFQYVIEEVPMAGGGSKSHHVLKGWWNYGEGAMPNPWNARKLSRSKKTLQPRTPEGENAGGGEYGASVGFEAGGKSSGSGEGAGKEESGEAPASEEKEESGGNLDDIF